MPKLIPIDAEPLGPDVIDRLEDVLSDAHEGKISAVAIAVVYRDGSSNRSWSKTPSLSTLIGAVARLEAALIRRADCEG